MEKRRIGQYLMDENKLTPQQLEQALSNQEKRAQLAPSPCWAGCWSRWGWSINTTSRSHWNGNKEITDECSDTTDACRNRSRQRVGSFFSTLRMSCGPRWCIIIKNVDPAIAEQKGGRQWRSDGLANFFWKRKRLRHNNWTRRCPRRRDGLASEPNRCWVRCLSRWDGLIKATSSPRSNNNNVIMDAITE